MNLSQYEALVIGTSAGGFKTLELILPHLPENLAITIVVVQHLYPNSNNYHIDFFKARCKMQVKEAEEKETLKPGVIYFAAANYHLLIERDKTFSFSVDKLVNFSRPSIDVLFECASVTYGKKLIGMILTGANDDGAKGLQQIKKYGGLTIVQEPKSAEVPFMPQAAIAATEVDYILELHDIADFLSEKNKYRSQFTKMERHS